jgi:hypothetical protein
MKSSLLSLMTSMTMLASIACGSGDAGGDVASGGSTASAGSSATAGSGLASGGSSNGGSASNVPLAGNGQAVGGGDQGRLFGPGMVTPLMPEETGGTGAGGGATIPGDGHMVTSMIRGSINGTATFTQTGEDVTLVVSLSSGCADGNHQFRIHDGYSCDNDMTEGVPWVPRGVGIGPESGIACKGGKGTLTYTRVGADKTKNWTVADQNAETDLTTHVVIVSDEKNPDSRASCGNFF